MDEKYKKIKIIQNGPYVVSGKLPLEKEIIKVDENGEVEKWEEGEKYPDQENYLLCRCGQSKNKPYCDQTHRSINFDGTETATKGKYLNQVEKTEGPELDLLDVPKLCASARFCMRKEGTWELTEKSNDPEAKKMAIQQSCDCPSGRLVALDKKIEQAIEPKLDQSLSVVEDPQRKVSGPIWVKGGVLIESADGSEYEIRNRATLCRCGKSKNKPFCDGTHITAKFNDEDKSLN
jgi:CDGSH-type Zn-finger protein